MSNYWLKDCAVPRFDCAGKQTTKINKLFYVWIKILPHAVAILSLSIHFKRILICVCPEVSVIISVILLLLCNCYFWKKVITNSLQLLQMQGVVTFFGRVAILIDQNTQAFHMFVTALLQVIWWSCISFLSLTKGSFVFGDWNNCGCNLNWCLVIFICSCLIALGY